MTLTLWRHGKVVKVIEESLFLVEGGGNAMAERLEVGHDAVASDVTELLLEDELKKHEIITWSSYGDHMINTWSTHEYFEWTECECSAR